MEKKKDWVRVSLSLSRSFLEILREISRKDKRSMANEIEVLCLEALEKRKEKDGGKEKKDLV